MNVIEEFQKFKSWLIVHKENYVQLLKEKPYCIEVKHDNVFGKDMVLFKYSQIESDFNEPFVRICRGLILDANSFDVICFPFVKFFNYGECYADEIDWKTSVVSSKIDGSIIKVVAIDNGNYLISTNSTIDAFKCNLTSNVGCPYKTFGELAMEGFKHYGLTIEDFPRLFAPGYTYIFELTSPWNQVVVRFEETKVWFLGVRDNSTFKETFYGDHVLSQTFDTPHVFPITTIDQCIAASKVLPEDAEGYVVCDAEFRRIKVKSPRYVQLHYMAGNQNWSTRRVLEILLTNEVSEYIAYFPLFKAAFDVVKAKYEAYLHDLEDMQVAIDNLLEVYNGSMPKKEFARWVFASRSSKVYSGFAFAYFDCVYVGVVKEHPIRSAKDYVDSMGIGRLVDALGLKNGEE